MADRVVSLSPSATETIAALNRSDALVGRTKHSTGPGVELGGWLTPDIDRVTDLDPDLVIATDELQTPLVERLEARDIEVVHLQPERLADVPEYIVEIGTAVGASEDADKLARAFEERIARLEASMEGVDRPVVYCEEWQSPPMVAGNWIPDVVRVAGGRYPFLDPGERSRPIDAETVEAAAPTHAILHICGMGRDVSSNSLSGRGWEIPAVRDDRILVVDDAILNQPSPSLLSGIERVAAFLHPDSIPEVDCSKNLSSD